MLEHVLDLGRAVEGERREALVERAHDRERMAPAVEEVRVTERDMARAHAHQTLDVAQNGVRLHDPDAPVVDGGDRAVPAAVHAAMAGLHVPDQALLAVQRQAGVALESGQQLARRRVEVPALQVDDRPSGGRGGRPGAASSPTQANSAGSYSPAIARPASSRSTSSRLTGA